VFKARRWVIAGVVAAVTVVGAIGLAGLVSATHNLGSVSPRDGAAAAFEQPVPADPVTPEDSATLTPTEAPTTAAKARTKTPAKAKKTSKAKTSKSGTTKSSTTSTKTQQTATSSGTLGTGRIQFGPTYKGAGTFYGADGTGNCSFDASSDLMVGAMNQTDYANSQACGAFLSVTGPNGNSITIRVVDRCPECAVGAIDLSAQAFAKLAAPSAGRINISWKLLSPAISTPVSYRYKTGSTQYWCGIQVLNHRNPIKSLQVKSGGTWKTVPRETYNYFVQESGAGCGGAIRITDIYGHQLTDTGIAVSPDKIQRGHAQFGPPT
jgi:expansin (peptidoglycan-binding protein)